MADSDLGFSIEGWDEFVERFADLVDKWAIRKKYSWSVWVISIMRR